MSDMKKLMAIMESSDFDGYYFAIYDSTSGFIAHVFKDDDGDWVEQVADELSGTPDHRFGSGNYMSYLEIHDIKSWLNRDYEEVLGPFESQEQARQAYVNAFGLDDEFDDEFDDEEVDDDES